MSVWGVIVAGGASTRMGMGKNKVLLPVGDEPMICHTVRAFVGLTDGIVIVCRPEEEAEIRSNFASSCLPLPVFAYGGAQRQDSVLSGVRAVPDESAIVLVHDGARCHVTAEVIRAVIDSVRANGSGIASVPVTDTVDVVDESGRLCRILDRSSLRACQTPQGFRREALLPVLEDACAQGRYYTDESSLMYDFGKEAVYMTQGDRANTKVTYGEDLRQCPFRVGHGYDVHRLTEGRKLILCGVEIPHKTGLLGHSDADVAVHALMDALLGAAGLGDIGRHFPDTDPKYEGISSMKLLEHVMSLLRENGWTVGNADVTIVAQRPKLAPYMPQMEQNLANGMSVLPNQVHLKATTTEKLGFEGREEGISAQAVCLLYKL